MVNRIALVNAVAEHIQLPPVQAIKFNDHLVRALALALQELPLQKARQLAPQPRGDLERSLEVLLTVPDLKKVSIKWDPERKIKSDAGRSEIAKNLIELLGSEREPYAPFRIMPLPQARKLESAKKTALAEAIKRLKHDGDDFVKLSKKWEPTLSDGVRLITNEWLLDLLHEKKEPYATIKLSLTEARDLKQSLRTQLANQIRDLSSLEDLKTLAKKWDKHNTSLLSLERHDLASSLVSLLESKSEPAAAPRRAASRNRARAAA